MCLQWGRAYLAMLALLLLTSGAVKIPPAFMIFSSFMLLVLYSADRYANKLKASAGELRLHLLFGSLN